MNPAPTFCLSASPDLARSPDGVKSNPGRPYSLNVLNYFERFLFRLKLLNPHPLL